jgi:hypothetical protein
LCGVIASGGGDPAHPVTFKEKQIMAISEETDALWKAQDVEYEVVRRRDHTLMQQLEEALTGAGLSEELVGRWMEAWAMESVLDFIGHRLSREASGARTFEDLDLAIGRVHQRLEVLQRIGAHAYEDPYKGTRVAGTLIG